MKLYNIYNRQDRTKIANTVRISKQNDKSQMRLKIWNWIPIEKSWRGRKREIWEQVVQKVRAADN